MRSRAVWAALSLSVAPLGAAQQFQQVGTGLPGPVVWSEGVEAFDADGDGRPDLLFSNGIGFSSAGGALAPTLLRNTTPAGGPISFADESAARLPAGFVQQGKALTPCDVDGDGDLDVAFANGFGNQPQLLINDGTGHFTNETTARLPAQTLNSFGLGCGDVTGDGAMDLALADAGASAFGSPGGKVRLYVNDGSGHFTDSPTRINAVNKIGAQNAQMVDLDNDFDLDVVVDGKSSGQQLYVNDGTGTFALSAGVLPGGSANTYATDWADLDNDHDVDGVYISLASFNEGTAQNGLIPGGALAFTGSQTPIGGHNGEDDNDFVFIDANDDGRLDVIVGSLGWNQEKLYLNAGTFAAGSFAYQATGFSTLTDSTLDLATADFDGDGRYDVATAQGESGGFTNRVYRNTGALDTRAPDVARIETAPLRVPLPVITAGGSVRRAFIQDAALKRGRGFVQARLDVTAEKDGVPQSFSVPMRPVGGQLHRGVIQPTPSPTGLVGMDVTFTVHAEDPSGNAADSPPSSFRICGTERYGAAVPNSTGQSALASGVNDPGLAANAFAVTVTRLPPGAPALLFFGDVKLASGVPLGAGLRFVDGSTRRVGSAVASGAGSATFTVDFTQPAFAGIAPGDTRYFQVQYQDAGTPGFVNASDALEVVFCD